MGAIGVHHTGTDDSSWDGPGNKARLRNDEEAGYYRKAYAWVDPEGDKETKAAYKFIHHFVDAEGSIGAASTRGAIAAIAVLNGGRGGADIPDSDRQGVYNHVAAHLRDADIDPPDLRAYLQNVSIDNVNAAYFKEGAAMERRYGPAELRVDQEGSIEGYAAVFNQLSEVMWGFREKIRPGAFTKTIKEADIRALFNHDPNYVLGRNKAATLDLSEDDHGLHFRVKPPETQWATDLRETVKRGDVDQASFAFQAIRDEWTQEEGEKLAERELIECKLFDVSPVTYPAYPQTSVSARSLAEMFISQMAKVGDPETINYLRDQLNQIETNVAPGQVVHPTREAPDESQVRQRRRELKTKLNKLKLV